MANEITLKDAINAWEAAQFKKRVKTTIHVSDGLLRRIVDGEAVEDKQRWYGHMVDCLECRDRCIAMLQAKDNQMDGNDVIIAKVAAEQDIEPGFTTLTSENGRYTITLRKNLDKPGLYLITVKVQDDTLDLEGRHIVVRDNTGKKIIAGAIVDDELSGWVTAADGLDFSFTTIQTG